MGVVVTAVAGLGVVVAHQLHHVLLQLDLGVRVLLAQLLEDELLGERPGHREPEELLEDQRLVLRSAHPPLVQVTPLRVLKSVNITQCPSIKPQLFMLSSPLP